jgi:2-hydroxychromene-2-carboxylate isomerase
MPEAIFYFDLGSPYAYLSGERLETVLGEPVGWQPILLGGLFGMTGRSSWSLGDPARRRSGIAEIERRAGAYGLPPLRWPEPWPANTLTAMRAAAFASAQGRGREFAREAFREAFQRAGDLTLIENVLLAGERAGLNRQELEAAAGEPAVKLALRKATEDAYALGVIGVPTVAIDDELFWGDDRLDHAAARLAALTAP